MPQEFFTTDEHAAFDHYERMALLPPAAEGDDVDALRCYTLDNKLYKAGLTDTQTAKTYLNRVKECERKRFAKHSDRTVAKKKGRSKKILSLKKATLNEHQKWVCLDADYEPQPQQNPPTAKRLCRSMVYDERRSP